MLQKSNVTIRGKITYRLGRRDSETPFFVEDLSMNTPPETVPLD